LTGFYPKGVALHKKLQRLAIEAEEYPPTIGDGLLAALILVALYAEVVYLLVIWLGG